MALPNRDSLKSQIITLFRKYPRIDAQDIHAAIGGRCTLQAIYKELRHLLAEGIVQKIGTEWTLNISWILQLQALSTRLASTYFRSEAVVPAIPRNGLKRWSFRNLLDMDDYWAYLLLYILRTSRSRTMLSWNPFLWFNVFHTENEDRFFNSVKLIGAKAFTVIGSNCFLNQWATQFLRKNSVTYSFVPSPFRDRLDLYFNVIDDYIISVKLSRNTDRKLQQLFIATKSFESLDLVQFSNLLMKQGRGTITLEHNPAKAARLRKQFSDYFGEDFSASSSRSAATSI